MSEYEKQDSKLHSRLRKIKLGGFGNDKSKSKALHKAKRTHGRVTLLKENGEYETKNYKINRKD